MTDRERVIREQDERQKQREDAFYKLRKEHEDSLRATGRTTRLVDAYVQELFNKKEVVLKDHHEGGENPMANVELAYRFKRRMQLEHDGIKVKYSDVKSTTTARIVKQ